MAASSRNAAAPSRSACSRGMKRPSVTNRSSRRRASASTDPVPASEASTGSASRPSTSPASSAVGIAHVAKRICSGTVIRELMCSILGTLRSRASIMSTASCADPVCSVPSAAAASITTQACSRSPNSSINRRYSATYGRSLPISESVFASRRTRFQLHATATVASSRQLTTTATGAATIHCASRSADRCRNE